MTDIWHVGEENIDNASGKEWDTLTGTGSTNVGGAGVHGGGQFGLRAWQVNHAANGITHQQHQFGASGNSGNKWFYGSAVQWDTLPGAECSFMQMLTTITNFLSVRLTTGGVVRLYRDDTNAQLGSDGPTLSTGTVYWIVFAYNGGDGAAELYVCATGGPLIRVANGTAALTQSSVRLRRGIITSTTGKVTFDDARVNNNAGTVNNVVPQETYLIALRPNADGDFNECSSGDFNSVKEQTTDDAGTLAVLDADGDRLDVNIETMTYIGSGNINLLVPFVAVWSRDRAAAASQASYVRRIKSQASGTLGESGTVTHDDTTFKTNGDTAPLLPYVSETDPQNSQPWHPLRIDTGNPQIGMRAVDATPDIELTQLWAYAAFTYGPVLINPDVVESPGPLGAIPGPLLRVA